MNGEPTEPETVNPLSPATRAAIVRAMVALYEVEAHMAAEPYELAVQSYSMRWVLSLRRRDQADGATPVASELGTARARLEGLARLGELELPKAWR